MTTLSRKAAAGCRVKVKSIRPDLFERILAFATVGMLAVVLAAMVRGRSDWANLTPQLRAHLITILAALALTPLLLLQRRGTRLHRRLGWAWAGAMLATALVSLFVHETGPGFSPIHLLSLITIVGVPITIWAARRHKVAAHRFGIRLAVTGALLIAGFFTFPFGRMMGRWVFG